MDRALRGIFWIALALGIAAMSLGVRQVDLGWQLPDGLALLATHHLPAAPTGAFGLPAHPFIDEYSLYEIGLASLDQVGGFGAIQAAFAAVYLLIFALPLVSAGRGSRDLLSGALVAVAAIFIINRFEQRPEIVGVLLLVLLLRLLLRARDLDRGFLLRLALLMAVWTNIHSSYLIGLFALGLGLAQRALLPGAAPRWPLTACALAWAVAGGAVLINPYGVERITFTFAQQADPGSNLLSREMWPVWDQTPGVQRMMTVAAGLLGLALVLRPRPPSWLAALALTLLALTLFNIRHMSFLAAALLYLAGQRREIEPNPAWGTVLRLLTAAGCLAVLLFDFVALRQAVSGFRETRLQHLASFAPALAEIAARNPGAVLCHDAEGSYLTLACPGLHPLMDSGQGRFDDATKRLYFFAVEDADAFEQTLTRLTQVNAVLIPRATGAWTLAMAGRPGWRLEACDETGLLFRRSPQATGEPGEIDPQNARVLARCRDDAIVADDLVRAFWFSAPIDPPEQSLRLLDRSRADDWSESFYSFARAWLRRQGSGATESFLAAAPRVANPLLRELLLERMPSSTPLPPLGASDLEHLARVATLLRRQEPDEALRTLRSVRKPLVSALYYTLRGQLDPEAARQAPAMERWQDWNAGGAALFDQTFPRLNARAAALAASPAGR